MAAIDLEAEGPPPHLALRLDSHVGPGFPTHDPVLDELSFMGSHVSRTARIEPVTPTGTVYVTEPFADRGERLRPNEDVPAQTKPQRRFAVVTSSRVGAAVDAEADYPLTEPT